MLTAISKTGQTVIASESGKDGTEFYCPECHSPVTLKKGTVIIHHFAHKPPVTCQYGTGETDAHRRAKKEIYDSLIYSGIEHVEMEKSFGDVRADIYALINGAHVAIEIQRSTLTPDSIVRRTSAYTRMGIHVLWLVLDDGRISKGRFIPKWWEKWVHAAYFGKVFYWSHREYVTPVKFETAQSYVEATEWGGGYMKDLKRHKAPVQGDWLSITEDFTPKYAKGWAGKNITIPDRRIFCERGQIRWSK